MSKYIDWMKQNPLSVAAGLIALTAVIMVGVVQFMGAPFRESAEKEANDYIKNAADLTRTRVPEPPASPNEPARIRTMVVAEADIQALEQFFDNLGSERKAMFERVERRNQLRHMIFDADGNPMHPHKPMLEGLFPKPIDPLLLSRARNEYRKFLNRLLAPYDSASDVIGIDPGMPPTADQIDARLSMLETNYIQSNYFPAKSRSDIADDQRKVDRLNDYLRAQLMAMLEQRAKAIHIYCEQDPAKVFTIPAWANPEGSLQPTIAEAWEGQMSLWIYQDIFAAIAIANQSDKTDTSVLTAPVKRLISVEVIPGYVTDRTSAGRTEDVRVGAQPAAPAAATFNPNQKISLDFTIGPTGRKSNPLYDVKYARLKAHIDVRKLPQFFSSLAKVNFMTPLSVSMKPVDEYDELRNGFVYGQGDIAEVDMLIETVWLRSWIAGDPPQPPGEAKKLDRPFNEGLMPDDVRERLGMARRDAPAQTETDRSRDRDRDRR